MSPLKPHRSPPPPPQPPNFIQNTSNGSRPSLRQRVSREDDIKRQVGWGMGWRPSSPADEDRRGPLLLRAWALRAPACSASVVIEPRVTLSGLTCVRGGIWGAGGRLWAWAARHEQKRVGMMMPLRVSSYICPPPVQTSGHHMLCVSGIGDNGFQGDGQLWHCTPGRAAGLGAPSSIKKVPHFENKSRGGNRRVIRRVYPLCMLPCVPTLLS